MYTDCLQWSTTSAMTDSRDTASNSSGMNEREDLAACCITSTASSVTVDSGSTNISYQGDDSGAIETDCSGSSNVQNRSRLRKRITAFIENVKETEVIEAACVYVKNNNFCYISTDQIPTSIMDTFQLLLYKLSFMVDTFEEHIDYAHEQIYLWRLSVNDTQSAHRFYRNYSIGLNPSITDSCRQKINLYLQLLYQFILLCYSNIQHKTKIVVDYIMCFVHSVLLVSYHLLHSFVGLSCYQSIDYIQHYISQFIQKCIFLIFSHNDLCMTLQLNQCQQWYGHPYIGQFLYYILCPYTYGAKYYQIFLNSIHTIYKKVPTYRGLEIIIQTHMLPLIQSYLHTYLTNDVFQSIQSYFYIHLFTTIRIIRHEYLNISIPYSTMPFFKTIQSYITPPLQLLQSIYQSCRSFFYQESYETQFVSTSTTDS